MREQHELADQVALEARLGFDSEPVEDSPYFDSDGQPQLIDAAVLFLDLLGTRGPRTADESRAHLRSTHCAVTQARQWSLAGGDKRHEGAIYSFSDNVGLGYPVGGTWTPGRALAFLCFEVGYLQLAFLMSGLFSRGAIALDLFFADPALEFIHGPALERAVNLEHDQAVHPRVILDDAAVGIAREALLADEAESGSVSAWREQLLVDEDGTVFVNYLVTLLDPVADDVPSTTLFMRDHKEAIEQNLLHFADISRVAEKYRWAASYHNHSVLNLDALRLAPEEYLVTADGPDRGFTPFGAPATGA